MLTNYKPCLCCTVQTGRYPGCHTRCKKYEDYRKELEANKKKEAETQFKSFGLFIFNNKVKECMKNGEV